MRLCVRWEDVVVDALHTRRVEVVARKDHMRTELAMVGEIG